tara:strand:+ start:325 stop:1605 length:1281 start_codon:yes stop_codon:yes gene_type:complete
MKFETVSVYGLGYIGLPTAAMFASSGVNVIGVDVNNDIIETINSGSIHIIEPGLDKIVSECVVNGKLRATHTPEEADAFIIAVPTPFKSTDAQIPEPDLTYIEQACNNIAKVLKVGNLVILESTSPVGATEKVCDWLSKLRPDLVVAGENITNPDVNIAHCPERVLPGKAMDELITNGRIIGGITPQCAKVATSLYQLFVQASCFETDARTAEMAKLTENASRDLQIAFANELSIICDELDINVWKLIKLANKHPRVNILQPGPGVGGHCIAVDPWFIANAAPAASKLIKLARTVNEDKPEWVIKKIKNAINTFSATSSDLDKKQLKIVCFGLTFKANIDDLRESPALYITRQMAKQYAGQVYAVEPNITNHSLLSNELFTRVSYDEGVDIGDIFVLLVDHDEFKEQRPIEDHTKIIIDTRGIWSK